MPNIDLGKYGIKNVKEVVYNPSYELLFEEETKASLEGYEKGKVTELNAVNVMTGIYTNTLSSTKTVKTQFGGHQKVTRMITTQ